MSNDQWRIQNKNCLKFKIRQFEKEIHWMNYFPGLFKSQNYNLSIFMLHSIRNWMLFGKSLESLLFFHKVTDIYTWWFMSIARYTYDNHLWHLLMVAVNMDFMIKDIVLLQVLQKIQQRNILTILLICH